MSDSNDRPGLTASGASSTLQEPPRAIELRGYLDVLIRRWWLIALTTLVAVAGAWWNQRQQVPQYTAEVLLQRHAERSPLEALGIGPASGAPREGVATELEILRSRAVLAAVVDSLGLRLVLNGSGAQQSRLISDVRVSQEAPAASYELAPSNREIALLDPRTGEALDEAVPGRWLNGPGFRARLTETVRLGEPVQLTIMHHGDAVESVRGGLKIEQVRGTSLIRVRYTSGDAALAAAVVNALAASYRRHRAARARQGAQRRREFILRQLTHLADSLEAAQEVLEKYQAQSATLDPRVEGQALFTTLVQAQNDVRSLRFQEGLLEALLLSMGNGPASDGGLERIVVLGGALVPGGQAMYSRLRELEDQRRRLTEPRYGYRETGPGVEELDIAIAAKREEMRAVTREALRLQRTRLQAAQDRVREFRRQIGELPERAVAFARLQQRVDAVQRIFEQLLAKYYEAQIAEAVEAGDVEVVDPASVPQRPDPIPTRRNLALALVVGLILGTGTAFGTEHLVMSIRSREDAERATRLAVLGSVPKLRARANGAGMPVVVDSNALTRDAEAFRMLRTTLRLVHPGHPEIIGVTSTGRGEGKSTVAVNLALALAHQGTKALLLDSDLRRPVMHRVLELERVPGLSDVLAGKTEVTDAIRSMGNPGLSVLSSGTSVPNPSEVLGSEAFRTLIEYAREHFDIVIADLPPILAAADCAVVGTSVDGVLVVVQANRTNRFALVRAVDQLRQVEAPLVGVVLNRVPVGGAYGGYYGYDQYYQG